MRSLKILVLSLLLSACTGFVPGGTPSVGSLSFEGLGFDRVSLRAVVENPAIVKDAGFVVSDTSRYVLPLTADGVMELELTGLKPGTEYNVFAFVGNGVNTITSEMARFCTKVQFPDEVFRRFVLDNFDQDGDGLLSETEASVVTELSIPAEWMYDIKSTDGVGFLKNLQYLCMAGSWERKSGLQTLDLSRFTRIDQFSCIGNNLKELDLSSVTTMGVLLCRENTSLKKVRINSKCNIHQLEVDPWTIVEYVD